MIHAVILLLAIQAATQSAPQHQEAGLAALKAGNKDQAIVEFKKGNVGGSDRPSRLFLTLELPTPRTGDLGSAIAPLKKALELDPGLAEAHEPLANALLAQGLRRRGGAPV